MRRTLRDAWYEIGLLFQQGLDTSQIARLMGPPMTEAYVAGTLSRLASEKLESSAEALAHREAVERMLVEMGEVAA